MPYFYTSGVVFDFMLTPGDLVMAETLIDRTIAESTGHSVEYLKNTPLDELRQNAEKKRGRPLRFVTVFPWIGRGNLMHDCLVSHEEAVAAYDDAIRRLPK